MKEISRPHRLALALALCSVWAAGTAAQEPEGPRPVATFPEFTHDFGPVVRGDRLRHAFVVRNDGDAVLLIESVHPT